MGKKLQYRCGANDSALRLSPQLAEILETDMTPFDVAVYVLDNLGCRFSPDQERVALGLAVVLDQHFERIPTSPVVPFGLSDLDA